MVKKAKWPKVIKGNHSTRIEHEDGKIEFIHDWDKLSAEVSLAIEKHEAKSKPKVKKVTSKAKKETVWNWPKSPK